MRYSRTPAVMAAGSLVALALVVALVLTVGHLSMAGLTPLLFSAAYVVALALFWLGFWRVVG